MSKKIDFIQNRPRRGHIVLFIARNGKVRLGEVFADPNVSQEELFVQDAGGARNRIKFRDVLLNLGASAESFAARHKQIENLAGQIDLGLLLDAHPEWIRSPGITVSDLAQEYFGKTIAPEQEAAMYLSLQNDSRFTLSGEKVSYRPPAPARPRRRSEQERHQLFETLRTTMTEALQKDWGAAEIDAHPLGKKLVRLARATLEQRRLYPEIWRKEFVLHLHSLNTLTGYRDARHLLFHWLKKIGRVAPEADFFIFSEPLLRRHARRLACVQDASMTTSVSNDFIINNERQPQWVVTIDNPETTDRDDALSFCRTATGVEIGVHTPLLEVLVPKETLFDAWAYDVGASAYLPHRKVPMLPPHLSNDLGSLNAGCERPVLSFYFLSQDEQPVRLARVICEKIKIDFNTDYDSIDAWLPQISRNKLPQEEENRREFRGAGNEQVPSGLTEALEVWATIAARLEKQRIANGAKVFQRDEVEVRVGPDGMVHLHRILRNSVAHKMVAEWMIAANQAAAQFCHEHRIPCIYRVQETLVPEREDEEASFSSGPVRAQLKAERAPHRDLGVDGYTQITSPLRRYGDLVMQRQIVAFLQTGKPHYSQTDLWARALAIEEMTRRIQRLESRADLYWKCVYLAQHLGETFTAYLGRSQGQNPRIILQLPDLDLRLHVPPAGIEGLGERNIPPHHAPMAVQVICLEMDADKATMRFQIK
ncbi:MAG: RNB domain-containing ribonuclease [candidate division KSB1 bacterium]|nr:RNB domain-containing ribonuclease [candidate division KSB1 bacterium]MDZ7302944.1 RNB domain-containing ribonuclease [candidate division KSB1 bacterium]MDZ7312220.1 RNB domain-containing ribonuclease [candidate division KSB1 bacterium]